MLSKLDSRKKAGEISGAEKFINDLETISKVLYADKSLPPRLPPSSVVTGSKSDGKSQLSEPKAKQKDAKNNKKDSSDKEKKPSLWSWKGIKALSNARNRRFNCCFSLQVHSIEGLPPLFDDVCLAVHWKRRDNELKTCPIRVCQGVAEFEEHLIHSCSVSGTRSGPHQLAKYEAKNFLLYVSVYNAAELDLGKHRIDLTRLFPVTLEELEEEKSSGKWTTCFNLSGKAKGATLNVTFGYVAIGNNSSQPSWDNNNVPEVPSLRQNSAKTESYKDHFDHMDEQPIRRVGSLPARLSLIIQPTENVKDLHEVLPIPTSQLCKSVDVLHQKLDVMSNALIKNQLDPAPISAHVDHQKLDVMSNALIKNQLDADPISAHVDNHKLNSITLPDSDEKISVVERVISKFSVLEKGSQEFIKKKLQSEEKSLKFVEASGKNLKTDSNGILEVPLYNVDAMLHASEEVVIKNSLDSDPIPVHVDHHKLNSITLPDSDKKISVVERVISKFSDLEKGSKEFIRKKLQSEEKSQKFVEASRENLETDSNSILEVPLDDVDDMLHASDVKNSLEADPIPVHVDHDKLNSAMLPDSDKKFSIVERVISKFSVLEKGSKEFIRKKLQSEEKSLKFVEASRENLETDSNAILEVPLVDVDDILHASDEVVTKNSLGADPVPVHVDHHKLNSIMLPDSDEKVSAMEREISEFSVVEKGSKEFVEENLQSEEESLQFVEASGENFETDSNGILEVPLDDVDDILHASAEVVIKNPLDADPFPAHVDHHKLNSIMPTDSDEKVSAMEWEISKLSFMEQGSKEFIKEHLPSVEESLKVVEVSRGTLETDGNGNLEVSFNDDDVLRASAGEIVLQSDDQLINTCNSTDERNDILSKGSIMKELETALSYATDLINEELVDFQEDESEVLTQEIFLDSYSHFEDHKEEDSLSLDDVTDSVATDFLNMLGIEPIPFDVSSESDPESPRERLLMQFEKDVLANGGLLDFDIDHSPTKVISSIPTESIWEAIPNDIRQSTASEVFQENPVIETPKMEENASRLEDLETENLMCDRGLNKEAFEHSPNNSAGFGSPVDIPPDDMKQLPPIAEGLGPFIRTENGGFLRSMNPALFRNSMSGGSLVMQVSSPVVVPSEMGSSIMDILHGLAAMGIEKLSMQANKLMPLDDITGKTIQQMSLEAAPSPERAERQVFSLHESEYVQSIGSDRNSDKRISCGPELSKSGSTLFLSDTEYVPLEDIAPLTMDKIEALSLGGLSTQSSLSDEDAPSNISMQSIGEFSALKGSIELEGTGALHLLDIKDKCEDVDGLMGLSLTLDEWVKLDSGEIDDDNLLSEKTSRILAAHHATSLNMFRRRSKVEKRGGKGRTYGLLGNKFTVALMVQLRDPLRNYEPVGAPMLGLIQVERVFVSPRPKIRNTVSLPWNANEEEEEKPKATGNKINIQNQIEEDVREEEMIPQYKITEVHIAGLKTDSSKRKLWGSKNQQQSGSRWLVAHGMGKKNKHPLMKSKVVVNNSVSCSLSATMALPGDTLWSISCRVHGTGARWKELAALNPHIRNPDLIFPNETIRLR